MRALVTGANGFIGRNLCRALVEQGHFVRAVGRSEPAFTCGSEWLSIESIDGSTDWSEPLESVDVVFHLAGIAHLPLETPRLLDHALTVNARGTARLAEAAAARGVSRLLFVSSVKVHGQESGQRPFREDDPPRPVDAYALSKWEAEKHLETASRNRGLPITILRPPLVYGPGVRANFLKLMRIVDRRVPLPFASVTNRRSLIFVGNLASALVDCATRPEAAGRRFLVSDFEDLSTPELIRRLADLMGHRPRLFSLPEPLIRAGAGALGAGETLQRLVSSLQVDPSAIADLGWRPPISVDEGLKRTVLWYQQHKHEPDD